MTWTSILSGFQIVAMVVTIYCAAQSWRFMKQQQRINAIMLNVALSTWRMRDHRSVAVEILRARFAQEAESGRHEAPPSC